MGNRKSMGTVIHSAPTAPDSWDPAPAAKEALAGPAVSEKKAPPLRMPRPKAELVAAGLGITS